MTDQDRSDYLEASAYGDVETCQLLARAERERLVHVASTAATRRSLARMATQAW